MSEVKQIVILGDKPDRMRKILLLVTVISSLSIKAQTFLPMGFTEIQQPLGFGNSHLFTEGITDRKWSLHPYTGITAGYGFFNGGQAGVLMVPLGLQLTRRLDNHFYAFARVSAGPAYVNFNRSFLSANVYNQYQANGLLNAGNLGIYSKAELGFMYVNDAKTFSVSGSIGVERGSYPVFPYQQMHTTKAGSGDIHHSN
jgi:hypothetical protein